ncbi:hypothetical protein MCOR13_011078, partial [Pyricularia oryzae]
MAQFTRGAFKRFPSWEKEAGMPAPAIPAARRTRPANTGARARLIRAMAGRSSGQKRLRTPETCNLTGDESVRPHTTGTRWTRLNT